MSAEPFNGHHKVEGRSGVWLTPRWILDALGPFDLDPCAAPDPQAWPTATMHYTEERDGLARRWGKGRVWLNPPYGREAWVWTARLADHGYGTALVPARTDTAGFHETVWARATGILFLRGRVKFVHPDGTTATENSGAPSCLVAYGEYDWRALVGSGLSGHLVRVQKRVVIYESPPALARAFAARNLTV